MGIILLVFGILFCIVGIVGIIFSITDRNIGFSIEPILITIFEFF